MRKVKGSCRLIWKKKRPEGDGRYSVEFTLCSDALLTRDLLTENCIIHGRTHVAVLNYKDFKNQMSYSGQLCAYIDLTRTWRQWVFYSHRSS